MDKSILVRVATGYPEADFDRCASELTLDRKMAGLPDTELV